MNFSAMGGVQLEALYLAGGLYYGIGLNAYGYNEYTDHGVIGIHFYLF